MKRSGESRGEKSTEKAVQLENKGIKSVWRYLQENVLLLLKAQGVHAQLWRSAECFSIRNRNHFIIENGWGHVLQLINGCVAGRCSPALSHLVFLERFAPPICFLAFSFQRLLSAHQLWAIYWKLKSTGESIRTILSFLNTNFPTYYCVLCYSHSVTK